jgi:hypothetical protein
MMSKCLVLIAALAAGCSAGRPRGEVYLAPTQASPVTPLDASLPPPHVAAHHAATGNACLMLYECDCNAGCTQVDEPLDDLRAGMRVGVLSGPLKGTMVFVAQSKTADGTPVLTVQRADPTAPLQICSTRASLAPMGYLCGTDKFGAARVCRSCDADDAR